MILTWIDNTDEASLLTHCTNDCPRRISGCPLGDVDAGSGEPHQGRLGLDRDHDDPNPRCPDDKMKSV